MKSNNVSHDFTFFTLCRIPIDLAFALFKMDLQMNNQEVDFCT